MRQVARVSQTATLAVDDALLQVLAERRFAVLATVVVAPESFGATLGSKLLVEQSGATWGSLGNATLDETVAHDAQLVMADRKSDVRAYTLPGLEGGIEVFHEILEPQPQLLILGAGHIALPLAKYASLLGFEVVVLDDREKYANVERFPDAHQVLAADFGETLRDFPTTPFTYIAIITRGHTFDEEALRVLLGRPAAYIGMIGSRRRVETVLRALAAEGFDRERLGEIYAPIGLDIGSETPEEIALAIIAEIVSVQRGGTGRSISRQVRPMAF